MQARRANPEPTRPYASYGDQRADDMTHYTNYFYATIRLNAHSLRERRGLAVVRELEGSQ